MPDRFADFAAFYRFYLTEHAAPWNRRLHFVGTSAVIALAVGAAATARWWLLLALPIAGYGLAWLGHFLIERNRPATFTHPLWSLRADFTMWKDMLAGRVRW